MSASHPRQPEQVQHFDGDVDGSHSHKTECYPSKVASNLITRSHKRAHDGADDIISNEEEDIQERVKKARTDEPSLSTPNSFPIQDNGLRPDHTYAQLIGMAILRAPQKQRTFSEISEWISNTYSYYKSDDLPWKHNIRHTISVNRAFFKQQRPKNEPGRGSWWSISPGMEQQFMIDDKTSLPPRYERT
ncbi:hypothetical protein HD806DRAFT_474922, partial [Xylariaceae sp. AK1471]